MQLFASTVLFVGITTVVYYHVGIRNILASYRLWFKDGYWVNYNVKPLLGWPGRSDPAGTDLAAGNLAATPDYAIDICTADLGVRAQAIANNGGLQHLMDRPVQRRHCSQPDVSLLSWNWVVSPAGLAGQPWAVSAATRV